MAPNSRFSGSGGNGEDNLRNCPLLSKGSPPIAKPLRNIFQPWSGPAHENHFELTPHACETLGWPNPPLAVDAAAIPLLAGLDKEEIKVFVRNDYFAEPTRAAKQMVANPAIEFLNRTIGEAEVVRCSGEKEAVARNPV